MDLKAHRTVVALGVIGLLINNFYLAWVIHNWDIIITIDVSIPFLILLDFIKPTLQRGISKIADIGWASAKRTYKKKDYQTYMKPMESSRAPSEQYLVNLALGILALLYALIISRFIHDEDALAGLFISITLYYFAIIIAFFVQFKAWRMFHPRNYFAWVRADLKARPGLNYLFFWGFGFTFLLAFTLLFTNFFYPSTDQTTPFVAFVVVTILLNSSLIFGRYIGTHYTKEFLKKPTGLVKKS